MILFRVSNLANWNYFENNFIIPSPLGPARSPALQDEGRGEGGSEGGLGFVVWLLKFIWCLRFGIFTRLTNHV